MVVVSFPARYRYRRLPAGVRCLLRRSLRVVSPRLKWVFSCFTHHSPVAPRHPRRLVPSLLPLLSFPRSSLSLSSPRSRQTLPRRMKYWDNFRRKGSRGRRGRTGWRLLRWPSWPTAGERGGGGGGKGERVVTFGLVTFGGGGNKKNEKK